LQCGLERDDYCSSHLVVPTEAKRSGPSPAAAIESYLPIVRLLVFFGGAMPALRERLLQRVEAALRPED